MKPVFIWRRSILFAAAIILSCAYRGMAQASGGPVGGYYYPDGSYSTTLRQAPSSPNNGNASQNTTATQNNSEQQQQDAAREEQHRIAEQQAVAQQKAADEAAARAKFAAANTEAVGQLKGISDNQSGIKGFDSGGGSSLGLKGLDNSSTALKPPYGDPMVVDSRNMPSGLPKFVEDAIPNTPAGARVKKGYEAVMEHDWKVALACFQDAHNHEPDNPEWKRLVDFAQFALNKRIETHTLVFENNSGPAQPVSTPVNNTQGSAQHSDALQLAQNEDMKFLFPLVTMTMPRTEYVEKIMQEHPELKSAIAQEWFKMCQWEKTGSDEPFLFPEEALFNANVAILVQQAEKRK